MNKMVIVGICCLCLCACGTNDANKIKSTENSAENIAQSSISTQMSTEDILDINNKEASTQTEVIEDELSSDLGGVVETLIENETEEMKVSIEPPVSIDTLAQALQNCLMSDYQFYCNEWGAYADFSGGGFTLYDINEDNIPECIDCIGSVIYTFYDGNYHPMWDSMVPCDVYYDPDKGVVLLADYGPYASDEVRYTIYAFCVEPENEIPYLSSNEWKEYIDVTAYYPVPGNDSAKNAADTMEYIRSNFVCVANGLALDYSVEADYGKVKVPYPYSNMPYSIEQLKQILENYYSNQ